MRKRTFFRRSFKALPDSLKSLLGSFENFRSPDSWDRDHRKLARAIAREAPCAVIVFTEPLARELWRFKCCVDMRREESVSELDEAVFRHFSDELNRRMSEYLKDHSDSDDHHLKKLTRSYYPKAGRRLLAEYKERHPRAWRRKWASGAYRRLRKRVEKRRRYDMPLPLKWGDTLLPQQYYFMRRSRTYARGCAIGSSTRECHSCYGLAFLELAKRISIPSHILVYDKDNALRLVAGFDEFVILPDSMGSNCGVKRGVVDALMSRAAEVTAVRSKDYAEIDKVVVAFPRQRAEAP